MALTAMQRLDLMDSLDGLIIQSDEVSGLDKLDILDQMEAVIVQLGGDAGPTPPPEPTPPPVPEPTPPAEAEVPEVVQLFRNGIWKGMGTGDFVNLLRELKQYVGTAISFKEIVAGANAWYRQMYNFQP